ncbi:hypothetical protein MLD52_23100, partial [Puniceicoccaceae bacterium K14]|nr:hypothetical protein [Puniceicoccaceae bacterium K14]
MNLYRSFAVSVCLLLAAVNLSAQGKSLLRESSSPEIKRLRTELEQSIERVHEKSPNRSELVAAFASQLSASKVPENVEQRKDLSRVWVRFTRLIRETEGTSPRFAEALVEAAKLDPDNEELERVAAYEVKRQENMQNLLKAAAEARKKLDRK